MEPQEHFSDYLKAQREKKGIRLEEIASITKIHLRSLELLEAGHWTELPPEPFIRGFIIAYAKYVGLEPKDVLARYYVEMGQPPAKDENTNASPQPTRAMRTPGENPNKLIENSKPVASGKLLAFASLVVVAGLAAGVIYIGKRTTPGTPDTTTASADQAPAETAPDSAPVNPPSEALAKIANSTSKPAVDARNVAGSPPAAVEPKAAEVPRPPLAPLAPVVAAEKPVEKTPEKAVTKPVAEKAPEKTAEKAVEKPKEMTPPVVQASTAAALPATKPAEATTTTGAAAATTQAAPPVEEKKAAHEVVIEGGKERSWLKVVIDNKPSQQSFLNEGEKITFSATEKIKIVLGNSAGAKVYHNGAVDEGMKYDGTIRYYRFPEHAKFPQDRGTKRHTATKTESAPADDGTAGSTGGETTAQ